MDTYLLLKMIHILGAAVLAGTGAGIAFFMLMASRSESAVTIALTARYVVLADWIFTAPAVVLQLVTGVLLMLRLEYSFTSTWFIWVIALFVLVGACWAPVVVIQYRLKSLAEDAVISGTLDSNFQKMMRLWMLLGVPAFTAILILFWLMVFKPFAIV